MQRICQRPGVWQEPGFFAPLTVAMLWCLFINGSAGSASGLDDEAGLRQKAAIRSRPSGSLLVLDAIFDGAILADNVGAVRKRAAVLTGEERFEYLARQVLPSETHASIRMSGAFTQSLPASVEMKSDLTGNSAGGELVSPVFDLLNAAQNQGRLGELLTRINAIPNPQNEFQRRTRAALLLLVNMEIDDHQAVVTASDRMYALAAKATPENLADMWPETLVVWHGVTRFSGHAASGRLRLARRGDEVYFLFAEGDSSVFRLVGQQTVTAAKTRSDGITLRILADGASSCSVVWKTIRLRAEKLAH